MFNFDRSDFQRVAVSAMGALIVSTACVTAAVGPARAAAPAPATIGAWQHQVERQIDGTLRAVPASQRGGNAVATVKLAFDAEGSFAGAKLAGSTGNRVQDAEALRTASRISYPALPAALHGRPQTVAMKIGFGLSRTQVREQVSAERKQQPAVQFAAR
ncbi:hypothetical protein ABC347_06695 [Sphingomonas sp. 1P06PA]|uniref:energy transducer TonB n=1 Tax=Sphingomonas sp. 1P06PA TaxID=554121 RepID=UPI0039A61EBE